MCVHEVFGRGGSDIQRHRVGERNIHSLWNNGWMDGCILRTILENAVTFYLLEIVGGLREAENVGTCRGHDDSS